MTIIPESKIQQEIFNYFNNTYCLKHHKPSLIIYSVPNGIPIPMPPKERARALDLLHKTGMVNGVSDLIIQGVNGKTLNVEVKTETGFQSTAQIEFQKKIEALGGVYIVVRSLTDFIAQLQKNNYIFALTNI
jgi:hypothetical protein